MRPFYKLISLLILTNIYTFSKAQNTVIFSGSGSSTKKKKFNPNNIIKVSPTGFFVGQFPITYERKITENFSIQTGIGITQQNFMRTAILGKKSTIIKENMLPWADIGSYTIDYADNLYNFDNRKATVGSYFTIQPKFYSNDEVLDGTYIGFSYTNLTYKFEHPKASILPSSSSVIFKNGTPQAEKENITDFMVHFGTQSVNKHLVFEFSTAFGIRLVKGSKYCAGNSFINQTVGYQLIDGLAEYKQTTVNYEVAFRVGYAF